MTRRTVLLAFAAGLALADASIVTLALPELLVELDTTVQGVASVIGVYTVVLALVLLPAELVVRRAGAARVGAAGFALFALASVACAAAGSLDLLLVARGAQAVGGAAGLVAAFALLVGGEDDARVSPRSVWLGVAVLSTAVGPAVGGALTQAFSWRAIFIAQVPLAAAAALACRAARGHDLLDDPASRRRTSVQQPSGPARFAAAPALALALLSAALSAVLFLLVLLLVAGWAVSPLHAAAAVTVLPIAALAGARIRAGAPATRAAAGCALVALGTWSLAALPDAHVAWTVAPQLFAGLGMGLALPALGGELLPERDTRDAAILLTLRHVGIAAALAVLAPITADRLDDATRQARERGVALVLDARLAPQDKLDLAPALLGGVEQDDPRDGLRRATANARDDIGDGDQAEFDRLAARADDTLVGAVGDSFRPAFLLTGLFALLAAVALAATARAVPEGRAPPRVLAVCLAVATLALAAQVVAQRALGPDPVTIADPCDDRSLPSTGGVGGFLQDRALEVLDTTACHDGSSREELVLALADPADARRYERAHGVDPRSAGSIAGSLLRGLLG